MPSHAPILLAGGAIAAGIALYAMNKKAMKTITRSWEAIFKENDPNEYVRILIRTVEDPLYYLFVNEMQSRREIMKFLMKEAFECATLIARHQDADEQDEKRDPNSTDTLIQKQMTQFAHFLLKVSEKFKEQGREIRSKVAVDMGLAALTIGINSGSEQALSQDWARAKLNMEREVLPAINRPYEHKIQTEKAVIAFGGRITKENTLWAYVEEKLAEGPDVVIDW